MTLTLEGHVGTRKAYNTPKSWECKGGCGSQTRQGFSMGWKGETLNGADLPCGHLGQDVAPQRRDAVRHLLLLFAGHQHPQTSQGQGWRRAGVAEAPALGWLGGGGPQREAGRMLDAIRREEKGHPHLLNTMEGSIMGAAPSSCYSSYPEHASPRQQS